MNKKIKEIRIRDQAISICEIFEDLLDRHDIAIPDEWREGDPSEARIYGEEWSALVDEVTEVLCDVIDIVKKNPKIKIDIDE